MTSKVNYNWYNKDQEEKTKKNRIVIGTYIKEN